MEGIKPPFMNWNDSNLLEQLEKFIRHCELIFTGPLSEKEEHEKVSYFLLWIGDEGRDIRHTWTDISDDENKLLETFYTRFRNYVRPTLNPVFARYQFYNETQKDETVDSFVTRLKLKAKDCNFTDEKEMIRDRIVFGTNSNKIREKLIEKGEALTLPMAIQICQNFEYAKEQMKLMAKEEVHAVKQSKQRKKKTKQSGATGQSHSDRAEEQSKQNRQTCSRCGYLHEHKQCPAKGQKCKKCGKLDHFKKMCRTKCVSEVNMEENDTDFEVDIVSISFHSNDQAFATILVGQNKTPITFKIDTGSQVNILPEDQFKFLKVKTKLKTPKGTLSSYTGDLLKVKGMLQLPIQYKGKSLTEMFYIVDTKSTALLSLKSSVDLELIKLVYSVDNETVSIDMTDQKTEFLDEFKDVFHGMGLMKGKVKLHLKPDSIPVINPPRRVPVALKEKLQQELERMEKHGIIAKVIKPTSWVNNIVIVEKPKTKQLRICLDPKALNNAIRRPHYPMRTFEEVTAQLANAKYFTVLDATSGYWSVQLDEHSSYYTTFNTPFGRWRFKRLAFGLNCSQDIFQQKLDQAFEGLPGVTGIVDDLVIWGRTKDEHDQNLRQVLNRARQKGIKFNPEKCVICTTQVSYFGHILSDQGIKPDPKKISAISEMDVPKNRAELETYLGMVTYMTKFAPNLASVTNPLRELLKKDVEFEWNEPQENAFQEVKTILSSAPVLAFFELITIQCDASKNGLGSVLLQKGKPVVYASKSLTPAETNYAKIEKEMLAILFSCRRFHQYIYGKKVTVESDHKPLSSIMKKSLCNATPRLQRMLLELQKYDLDVHYVPGKDIPVGDLLSRKYLQDTSPELSESIDLHIHTVLSTIAISDRKLEQVRRMTSNDPQCQTLTKVILSEWPEMRSDCPSNILEFWNHRDELSVSENIIFRGQKIVIPRELRKEMLEILHTGHMGVEKCLSRAKDVMFWPKMTSDVIDHVLTCDICLKHRNSNTKEPLKYHQIPELPWQVIGIDLMTFDNDDYLITVDYFSRYLEVDLLTDNKSVSIIKKLKITFSRFGIPQKVISDNAMYFLSESFQKFARDWNFEHVTSSPLYSQSNGLVEKTVQTVKRIFKKAKESRKDRNMAILEYRTTPLKCGYSPSQLLMNRRLRTTLPAANTLLLPQAIDVKEVRRKLQNCHERQKKYFDRQSKPLKPLEVGNRVRVQFDKQWKPGNITDIHSDRFYIVQTDDGGIYRRNRKFLFKNKDQNEKSQSDHFQCLASSSENEHNSAKQLPENLNKNGSGSNQQPPDVCVTRSGRTVKPNKYLIDPVWQK